MSFELPAPRAERPTVDAGWWQAIDASTRSHAAPIGVLQLDALAWNLAELERRANEVPLRLASKSVRVRELIELVVARPAWCGVLAYTLPEALWLAERGIEDVVVGYPSVDRAALQRLAADELLAQRVTIMVDDVAQLDLVDAVAAKRATPIRVALELDASFRNPLLGHIGVRRSPVHEPAALAALAEEVASRAGFRLVGLMAYEAQIAGVGDADSAVVRVMQRASVSELAERRAEAVQRVRAIAPLEFVNGGGTGSIESTGAESAVTEIAAGSGLFGPHLFDHYTRFQPAPAAAFGLDVVRKPLPNIATVLGGGWIASGPPGDDRLPLPVWPAGLGMLQREGAGEVQTPLKGAAAERLVPGDRVWFRHTKAGELAEHLDGFTLLREQNGEQLSVGETPSYRGEGKVFL